MKVYKYTIPIADEFAIEMPALAKVLCVQVQRTLAGEQPQVWALVNDGSSWPTERRRFRLAGTGHPIDLNRYPTFKYVGSFQLEGGALVFHLFDLGPEEAS